MYLIKVLVKLLKFFLARLSKMCAILISNANESRSFSAFLFFEPSKNGLHIMGLVFLIISTINSIYYQGDGIRASLVKCRAYSLDADEWDAFGIQNRFCSASCFKWQRIDPGQPFKVFADKPRSNKRSAEKPFRWFDCTWTRGVRKISYSLLAFPTFFLSTSTAYVFIAMPIVLSLAR